MVYDAFRNKVKSCLEESGYKVSIIPEENDVKRADLFAKCDSDALIIEVKCKFDDKNLCETLNKTEPGKQVPYFKSIKRQNHLASLVKKASEQINATRQLYGNVFGVIWFRPNPLIGLYDSDKQIKLNLYGGRYAFVDAPNGSKLCVPCYYCTYSDFYRYRNIDAVILNIEDGALLLPNPFSAIKHDFQKTRLYQDFEHLSAIWTPELSKAEETALYIEGSFDLQDQSLIKYELEKQNPGYRIIMFVEPNSIGGVMKI